MASKHPDSPPQKNDTAKAEDNSKEDEKILFWCPECGQKYRLPKDSAGETGVCFKCQNYIFIPSKSQEQATPSKKILFACVHCGSKQQKARKYIGIEVKCNECGKDNVVPEKSKISSLSKKGDVPEEKILFWCHYCGQKYRLPKHLAGKSGNCDRCQNDFIIPTESQEKAILQKTSVFPCEHCGQKQWKAREQIGEEFECGGCSNKSIIPDDLKIKPSLKPQIKKEDRIFFWCSHCGQKYRLPRDMAGKTAICDKCQKDFIIPIESQVAPKRKEIITFPCQHCGEKIQKTKDLIGTKISCRACNKENIVPEKSKKSLFDLLSSKNNESLIAAEATRMNLKLPQQMTKPSISPKEEVPVEVNTPEKEVTSVSVPVPEKTPVAIPAPKNTQQNIKLDPELNSESGERVIKKGTPVQKGIPVDLSQDKTQRNLRTIPLDAIKKAQEGPIRIFPKTEKEILFWCSYCKQKYRLPHKLAGKKSFCDNCNNNLFIPTVSQTKPQFKDTIIFPCANCNKKLWKPQELIGTAIFCHECGEENIVPKKSDKSLLQAKTPTKLQNASITHEFTKTNMIVVGQAPIDPNAPLDDKALPKEQIVSGSKKKFKSKVVYNTDPVKEQKEKKERKLPNREDYIGPQIVITEDPPTIHKIKHYFQKKAEKYFIFAMFVLLIDYLINTYGEGIRPSKTFVIFASFTISAIILLLTWNFISYRPPSKTSKCQYNVTCLSPKCNLNKISRYENVNKGKCSKCSSAVGLAYRCRNCNKSYVYDEVKSKNELKAKNKKDAKRKEKWFGEKIKIKDTLFNNRVIKKCPACRSTDVYYVTVKQAKKEAEQATIEKDFQKVGKKIAKKKKKK